MKIQIFETFNNSLEKEWKNIEREVSINPFQSFDWLNLWYDEIGSKIFKVNPKIFLIKTDDQEKIILPLCIKKKNGFKILEWMGDINSDYMGFITSKNFNFKKIQFENFLKLIFNSIEKFDVLYLKNQLPQINSYENPFYSHFKTIYKKKAYSSDLNENWEQFYKLHQNSKSRETTRRKLKKIKVHGKLNFNIADTDVYKIKIIKDMIKLKKNRYINTKAWNMFSKKEFENFYIGLSKIKSESIRVHCSELKINDQVISNHVGISTKKCFYYLMPAFDDSKWNKFSPGLINLIEIIKWCIDEGINFFDFTTGDEKYKAHWFDNKFEIRDNIQYFTFKGFFYEKFFTLKMILKKNLFFEYLKKIFNYVNNLNKK